MLPCLIRLFGCVQSPVFRVLEKMFTRGFLKKMRIVCTSSTSTECIGYPKKIFRWNIEKIESYDYREYWRKYGDIHHVRIDTSETCTQMCGKINKIYLRSDGCIVVSHEDPEFLGVHVIVPVEYIRNTIRIEVLKQMYRRTTQNIAHNIAVHV